MRKACIDVGSNSILLTVEEKSGGIWSPVSEESSVTALGEGVNLTGNLKETKMVETLQTIKEFDAKAKSLGCEKLLIGATMAVRIARNQQEFLERAKNQGTPIEVISGDREAQLGFDAVAYDKEFQKYDWLSIIDPGGQSTELTIAQLIGNKWHFHFRTSFPIGTLALRAGILSAQSPSPENILMASAQLDELIYQYFTPQNGGMPVVLGATGTNLVSMREKLTIWDPVKVHGSTLSLSEVTEQVIKLSQMTDEGRASLVGIEPGREKTIHLGALVLERFLTALDAPACKVSVRGWRHALLEGRGLE